MKPKTDKPVALAITRYPLAQLESMLPVHGGGRFHELKLNLKRELSQMGKDEFFTLPAPAKVTERQAMVNALRVVTKAQGWVIKYTPVNNVFLVFRDNTKREPISRRPRGAALDIVLQAMAGLPNEFNITQLREALAGNQLNISSAIQRLRIRGTIKSLGYGVYQKKGETTNAKAV